MASIPLSEDKFPPEQVKEMIGQLSVAVSRSTDPAVKISLTSSRISTLMGVLEYKCREWLQPGLKDELYDTILRMISDMLIEDHPSDNITPILKELEQKLSAISVTNFKEKKKYLPKEGLILLRDFNEIRNCRKQWKDASDVYMANNEAWSISNKAIADINDILASVELRYNLIIMPKNYSYDVGDLNIFKRSGSGGGGGGNNGPDNGDGAQ